MAVPVHEQMTIADVKIGDQLVGHWMMRYIKGCSPKIALRRIIESNSNFATIFRIAALASVESEDRAVFLTALGQTEAEALHSVQDLNPHYGPLAAAGLKPLRAALLAELPAKTRRAVEAAESKGRTSP